MPRRKPMTRIARLLVIRASKRVEFILPQKAEIGERSGFL